MTTAAGLDGERIAAVHAAERERFAAAHPRSRELFARARGSLVGGVPMTWMAKGAGGHPVDAASARGASVTDVDGHVYVDLALGDTGAMAGHSPPATVAAVERRLGDQCGATVMLPTEDAAAVGEELGRRFGVPLWSFALTATDANRWALRLCRAMTRRPYVLVFSHCYHCSVDETFVTLEANARPRSREGNVGPAVDPTTTTRVCEFNDLPAVERLLADRQVACVLTEPALTNIGIVLPADGFLAGLRAACDATGTLLVIDETHTLSAGPGGPPRRVGRGAGPRDDRQGHRRRHPDRRLRRLVRGRRAHRRARRRRPRRRRRRRRHARGQPAVARGRPRDAREGAHRGRLRAHGRAVRPLRRRRARRAQHAARPVVDRRAR